MKRNKSWLIIGSFLIIVGIGLIGYDYYSNKSITDDEDIAIAEFYENEEQIDEAWSYLSLHGLANGLAARLSVATAPTANGIARS